MIDIILMALVVYFTRYFFLEPKLPIRLNPKAQKILSYSSLAVMPAIAAPIVFLHQNQHHDTLFISPYVIAAVVAVVISWKTRNVLLTTITSMLVLSLLIHW